MTGKTGRKGKNEEIESKGTSRRRTNMRIRRKIKNAVF
jgi:hypothetical protein